MDIKVIFLLTMATYCAFCQLTRDPKLGSTEGRVSCLEDTYMRLESYGTAMRNKMNEMEVRNEQRYQTTQEQIETCKVDNNRQLESLQEQLAGSEAENKQKIRTTDERIKVLAAENKQKMRTTEERIEALKDENAQNIRTTEARIQALEAKHENEFNAAEERIEALEAINAAQQEEINALKTYNKELPNLEGRLSCNETFDLISSPRYGVPDASLTASSEPYSNRRVSSSRLSSSSCWAGDRNKPPIWIKVDFGQDRIVQAIQTTRNFDGVVYWIKRYTVSTSQDDVNWNTIQKNGEDLVFDGNTDEDPDDIVTNQLHAPIKTRFVRLNVVEWFGTNPGLRWAVVGCPI